MKLGNISSWLILFVTELEDKLIPLQPVSHRVSMLESEAIKNTDSTSNYFL